MIQRIVRKALWGLFFFCFFEKFFVPILTSGGYVGLSIATLLSQHHQVTAVDIIPEKVDMINNRKSPIQDDYIEKYLAEKELNLTATLDAKAALNRTNNIKELVEIYSAADVYFNPTYEDNFPTTNLEATACGTPVITYDTGGSPESVDPRAVVQKGNLNRVKDIICSELQIFKPRLRDEMKVESMVAEYIQLYRDVYGE